MPLLTNRETVAVLFGDNPETGRALGAWTPWSLHQPGGHRPRERVPAAQGHAMQGQRSWDRIASLARSHVPRTIPTRRARSSSRCSSRPRSSPRSCSRRTSGSASRSPASRGGGRRAAGSDEQARELHAPDPRARGAAGGGRGALPEGRGGEQGVRRPLHRDRGAEQQPRQPLRRLLPAPLDARLQGGHPHRPGDRDQPDRRGGVPHLHGQRQDGPARAGDLRGPGRRRDAIPIGEGRIGKAAKTGENYFADKVAHRSRRPSISRSPSSRSRSRTA